MMNKRIVLSVLLALFFTYSCKKESENELRVFNTKTLLLEATMLTKTPLMLGTSVYNQLENNRVLSVFKEAMPQDLKELLLGTAGPYTVFVPSNKVLVSHAVVNGDIDFFKKHTVKGKLTTIHLVKRIREYGGVYSFISIAGTELKAKRRGMDIVIEDSLGNTSLLMLTDYLADNGVLHVIDGMLK